MQADFLCAFCSLMAIDLSNLEAETRCPVCLGKAGCLGTAQAVATIATLQYAHYFPTGVIKNARLVSGCMHRFCAECIEKWLRVCRYAAAHI